MNTPIFFANTVLNIIILLLVVMVFLTLRWLGKLIVRHRQVAAKREREPETHGDDGGRPINGRPKTNPKYDLFMAQHYRAGTYVTPSGAVPIWRKIWKT